MIGTLLMNTTHTTINYAEVAYFAFILMFAIFVVYVLIRRRLSSGESDPEVG